MFWLDGVPRPPSVPHHNFPHCWHRHTIIYIIRHWGGRLIDPNWASGLIEQHTSGTVRLHSTSCVYGFLMRFNFDPYGRHLLPAALVYRSSLRVGKVCIVAQDQTVFPHISDGWMDTWCFTGHFAALVDMLEMWFVVGHCCCTCLLTTFYFCI